MGEGSVVAQGWQAQPARSRNVRIVAGLIVVGLALAAGAIARPGGDLVDPGCSGSAPGPAALIGFDTDTGEKRWSATVGWPTGAAVFEDVVVVSSTSNVVRAFDTRTGAQIWCREPGPVAPEAGERLGGIVGAGSIVASFAGNDVMALDPATGIEQWQWPIRSAEAVLQGGEALWILDGSAMGGIVAVLDPATGDNFADPPLRPPNNTFALGVPPTVVGDYELVAEPNTESNGQEAAVTVSHAGETLWRWEIPGFVAALASSDERPVALVLDQTGGTGEWSEGGADTRLTGYSVGDGQQKWQIALPGTPHVIAPLADSLVVVPSGAELHGIEPATGTVRWVVDHGSPGRRGKYSLDGTYWFIATGAADTAVGLIRAEEPYRD